MSTSPVDLKRVQQAYARLSEKFKTLWTFHQYLQGIHKNQFGEELAASVAFAPLYEQIKKIKETKGSEKAEDVLDSMARLDTRLEAMHAALLEDDRRLPTHAVRQFFERVKTEDEKLLVSLLKFYFYTRELGPEELDKVDLLFTRIGTHRGKDGTWELRSPEELQELCREFLALTGRTTSPPEEVKSVLAILNVLRHDIDACTRFEDLSRKKPLENIRTLKRRMGPAFYSPEVMTEILASNIAARRKFHDLYAEEEKRILDSSRQLLDMEKDLERDARFQSPEFQADLRRFRKDKEDFEKQSKKRGVRPRDVKRLKESIHRLLRRIDPAAAAAAEDTGSRTDPRRRSDAAPTPLPRSRDTGIPDSWRAENDPLTAESADRLRRSVDLIGPGARAADEEGGAALKNLKLEPWEVHAALRVVRRRNEMTGPILPNERLFFNAAALRLRMDEEAQKLRDLVEDRGEQSASDETLEPSARCLVRARDIDGQFRRALQDAADRPAAARMELTRSRFRHLRAFAGLWLLFNGLGGGETEPRKQMV